MESSRKLLGTIAGFNNFIDNYGMNYKDNPNKVLKDNNIGLKELSYLMNDPHVSCCVQSRKTPVQSFLWDVDRGSEKNEMSKFAVEIINKIGINKVLSDMLEAPLYGFKVLEIIWNYDGDYIMPQAVIGKPSWWFDFDRNGNLKVKNKSDMNGTTIPKHKVLLIQHNATYDNPYGDPLLAKCFYPVTFLKTSEKLWSIYIQKYGMAYLVGEVDLGMDEGAKQKVFDSLCDMQQDGVIVVPKGVVVSLLEAATGNAVALFYDNIRVNQENISKVILGQTLTTQQGSTGSFSMAQIHYQVLQDVVDSDKLRCEAAVNELIQMTIKLNYPNVDDKTVYPKFELYAEEDVDMNIADRDVKLCQTNQIRFTKTYWMDTYGFRDEDIEIVEAPLPNANPAQIPQFSEHGCDCGKIHDFAEYNIDKFDELTQAILKPIIEMASNAETYDDIQNKVIEMFPDIDTEEMQKYIADGIMIANGTGIIDGAKK